MSVNAIEREDFVKLIDNVASCSGSSSNRTLSLLSAVFNVAIDHELIDMNPTARLKPRHKAISRDRVLSTAALPVVWRAMIPHGHVSSTFMRLVLLTAQRGDASMLARLARATIRDTCHHRAFTTWRCGGVAAWRGQH
jgi:hypothetical protein